MENTDPHASAGQDFAPEAELDPSARIADLENQLGAVRDEQLRERAELDNQRKRLVREVDQARKFANERLLGDLLPVFDSLEAGLSTVGDNAKLREGLELTLRQLQRVAEANGLTAVDPAGQAFNPEQHQAVSTTSSAEHAAGIVVQVFQKGYVLNERLLRPALVVVAQ